MEILIMYQELVYGPSWIQEFGLQYNPMRQVLFWSHFTDEETEA